MQPQVWHLIEDCVTIYKKRALIMEQRLCFVLNRRRNPKGGNTRLH